jgi:phage gp29-like protein
VLPYLPSDADGNPTAGGTLLSVEQQIANQLANFRNGTYLVLPFGATAQPLQVAGDGQAFMHAFDRFDRQISVAILHQTLATGEAQHSSRAQATVHQDVMAILVRMGKRAVARMLRKDVFTPLVRYNFGEEAARTLTPSANLGEVEAEDLSPRMIAVATLADKGLILPSQLPEIYGDLGLPQASPEDLATVLEKFVAPPPPPTGPPPGTPAENAPPARGQRTKE